jgi:hypothetical protein
MNVRAFLSAEYWKLKQGFFIGPSKNSLTLRIVYSQYQGPGVSGQELRKKLKEADRINESEEEQKPLRLSNPELKPEA